MWDDSPYATFPLSYYTSVEPEYAKPLNYEKYRNQDLLKNPATVDTLPTAISNFTSPGADMATAPSTPAPMQLPQYYIMPPKPDSNIILILLLFIIIVLVMAQYSTNQSLNMLMAARMPILGE